ncbi:hypothetical protein [Kitasatospora sp. NPDC050463]|uniref:hypothetical protein n=1 Tax=Kitasatospora sp. NPDC050463 TaxID=3155786 RepID=UPI0033EA662F
MTARQHSLTDRALGRALAPYPDSYGRDRARETGPGLSTRPLVELPAPAGAAHLLAATVRGAVRRLRPATVRG